MSQDGLSPKLTVTNRSQQQVDCSVGCRRDEDVIFADKFRIEAQQTVSHTVPATPEFELGVKTDLGLATGEWYPNGSDVSEISIEINNDDITIENRGAADRTAPQVADTNQETTTSATPTEDNTPEEKTGQQTPESTQQTQSDHPDHSTQPSGGETDNEPATNEPKPTPTETRSTTEPTVKASNDSGILLPLIVGLIVTKIALFIPIVHFVAGIVGGFVAAFIFNGGPLGGMKIGFIKGLIAFIPLLILSIFLSSSLATIPIIGGLLADGLIVFVLVLTMFITVKAVIGGFIGGLFATVVREQVEP